MAKKVFAIFSDVSFIIFLKQTASMGSTFSERPDTQQKLTEGSITNLCLQ